MYRSQHLIASSALAICLAALQVSSRADDRPVAKSTDVPSAREAMGEKHKLEQELAGFRSRGQRDPAVEKRLLAAFPFVSLEDRLQFDGPGRKRLERSLPTVDLELSKWKPVYNSARAAEVPAATRAMLTTQELLDREQYFQRTEALAALHKLEVRKFVTNPGFGRVRLINRRLLDRAEPPLKDWSEGDRGEVVVLPKSGTFFTPNEAKNGPTLPALFALGAYHGEVSYEFARPDSWGLVKDRKQVAGFQPHALEFMPSSSVRQRRDLKDPIKDADGKVTGYRLIERWAVRKVELVGLLMNETPVVYLNPDDALPTMAGIKEAKTRELTEFEAQGMKEIARGKEAVFTSSTTNQIRMIGAIRMGQACLKCHDGKPGDLLGAFTYDLVRDPPFVPSDR